MVFFSRELIIKEKRYLIDFGIYGMTLINRCVEQIALL